MIPLKKITLPSEAHRGESNTHIFGHRFPHRFWSFYNTKLPFELKQNSLTTDFDHQLTRIYQSLAFWHKMQRTVYLSWGSQLKIFLLIGVRSQSAARLCMPATSTGPKTLRLRPVCANLWGYKCPEGSYIISSLKNGSPRLRGLQATQDHLKQNVKAHMPNINGKMLR